MMKWWQNTRNKQTNMPARKEGRKEERKENRRRILQTSTRWRKKSRRERWWCLARREWRWTGGGRRTTAVNGEKVRKREREWQRNAYAAGGELKGLAGERWGKISSTDNSIRDLTLALIIAWAPLQPAWCRSAQTQKADRLLNAGLPVIKALSRITQAASLSRCCPVGLAEAECSEREISECVIYSGHAAWKRKLFAFACFDCERFRERKTSFSFFKVFSCICHTSFSCMPLIKT